MNNKAVPNRTAGKGGSHLHHNPAHIARWLDGEHPGPLSVEVSLLRGCNHNCIHCGFQQYSPYDKNSKYYLCKEYFLNFLQDFKELGGVEVYFAGSGEPLLHPDFSLFAKFCADLGLSVGLSTNGAFLEKDVIHKALPYISWVRFSVNGGDNLTYARVHRTSTDEFERVMTNIKTAAEFRNRTGIESKLMIQFIAYMQNMDSIFSMAEAFETCGADELILRGVFFKNGYTYTPENLSFIKMLEKRPGINIRWESFRMPGEIPKWDHCLGIYFRTNLDHAGRLFTCNRHLIEPSVFGDITRSRFRDIWNSSKKKEIFEQISRQVPPSCHIMCQSATDNIYLQTLNL